MVRQVRDAGEEEGEGVSLPQPVREKKMPAKSRRPVIPGRILPMKRFALFAGSFIFVSRVGRNGRMGHGRCYFSLMVSSTFMPKCLPASSR